MDEETKQKMIRNMERYGGSFVRALGVCFLTADHVNTEKLLTAFPEYVEKYSKMEELTA